MMAAGSLFGFLGVLLAVPLGAVAKILLQRAVRAYLASEFYNRQPDSPIVEPTVTIATKPRDSVIPGPVVIIGAEPQPKR